MPRGRCPRARRADKVLISARLDDLIAIRLAGAELRDVYEHVRSFQGDKDSCWHVKPGDIPLCRRSIKNYLKAADKHLLRARDKDRPQTIARHLAQRRNLYARSVAAGDYGTALACLKDEAKILALYPIEDGDPNHTAPLFAGAVVDDTITEDGPAAPAAPSLADTANAVAQSKAKSRG